MSITEKEAFELGFLQRCADEGLTPEQTERRIKQAESLVKQGAKSMGWHVDQILNALGGGAAKTPLRLPAPKAPAPPLSAAEKLTNLFKEHPKAFVPAAAGLPIAGGFGAGYMTRKVQGDFLDADDVKKQELINQYRDLSAKSKLPQTAEGL